MITRGIVEEIVSPYQVSVRIPSIDRTNIHNNRATKNNLNIATICSLPRCNLNLQPGDVVFVAFEDNHYNKELVILGVLYKETATVGAPKQQLQTLDVFSNAVLPIDTQIGEVSSTSIQSLRGCKGNIQEELNMLKQRVLNLETKLSGGQT